MSEPLTAFFPFSNILHNFSFLHLVRVCVRSHMARDQVEEEQALKRERPVAGNTLVIHRVV